MSYLVKSRQRLGLVVSCCSDVFVISVTIRSFKNFTWSSTPRFKKVSRWCFRYKIKTSFSGENRRKALSVSLWVKRLTKSLGEMGELKKLRSKVWWVVLEGRQNWRSSLSSYSQKNAQRGNQDDIQRWKFHSHKLSVLWLWIFNKSNGTCQPGQCINMVKSSFVVQLSICWVHKMKPDPLKRTLVKNHFRDCFVFCGGAQNKSGRTAV